MAIYIFVNNVTTVFTDPAFASTQPMEGTRAVLQLVSSASLN